MSRTARAAIGLSLLAALAGWSTVRADCIDFKWDVSRERSLFSGAPLALQGGATVGTAPSIVPGRLYRLALLPQPSVTFAAQPGKAAVTGTHAGLALIRIDTPGPYRLAADAPVWMDVVRDDALIRSEDYQGQQGCAAPHKIVQFELPAGHHLVLQVSAAEGDSVVIAVTPAPLRRR